MFVSQMLAVISPIVAFHMIATYFAGQVLKLEQVKDQLQNKDDDEFFVSNLYFNFNNKNTLTKEIKDRREHALLINHLQLTT